MYVCMITAFVGDNKLILILSYLTSLKILGVLTITSSLSVADNGVGTNFEVGGRRGEAQRAESGGWGSWGGDSQLLPTNDGFAGAL